MSKSSRRFQSIADVRYFLSWETALVVLGTAILGILELNLIPRSWPLHWWVEDWKWTVLLLAVALIVLPPPIAKGMLHLRTRDQNAKKNVELSIALDALRSRTSNLVAKVREVAGGDISNTYKKHTVNECSGYFAARRTVSGQPIEHEGIHVEAVYYELVTVQNGARLERKIMSAPDDMGLPATFSMRVKGKSKEVVETICARGMVFEADLSDPNASRAFGIAVDKKSEYAVALGVPVVDRGVGGPGEVKGMLLVSASSATALQLSDAKLLSLYGWYLTVASALDEFAKKR